MITLAIANPDYAGCKASPFQTGTSRDVIETISCAWLGLRHTVLATAARPRFAAALPAISGRDLLIGKQTVAPTAHEPEGYRT